MFMLRTTIRVVIGFLLVVSAVSAADQPQPEKAALKVSYGHGFTPETPHHRSALKFKALVEERTGGKVGVDVFPGGQLGSAQEMFQNLQIGNLEIALLPTARISAFAPKLQLLDLPFLFPSRQVAYQFFDGPIGEKLLGMLEGKGIRGIAIYEDGFKNFTSNKLIRTSDDFKGQIFRIMESPLIIEQFKSLGAQPIPMAFAQVYNALKQGIADGQENPLVTIVNMRFYEVQKYLLLSEHAYLGHVFMFSKKWFDALPKDIQKILSASGRELAAWQRQAVADEEKKYLQIIRDSGTRVFDLSDSEETKMRQITFPVHKVMEGVLGRELLEQTYAEIEKLGK